MALLIFIFAVIYLFGCSFIMMATSEYTPTWKGVLLTVTWPVGLVFVIVCYAIDEAEKRLKN